MVRSQRSRAGAVLILCLTAGALLTACGGSSAPASSSSASGSAAGSQQSQLDAQQLDVLDQQVTYPRKGVAAITSAVVTLEPGQETGWRRNKVPLYVHVLEGTLSIEFDGGVVKEFPAGSTFMDGQGVWHNATNKGTDTLRMETVYFGAKGARNYTERSQ
jgi:quercetin dioxygenase-like cupin family protein